MAIVVYRAPVNNGISGEVLFTELADGNIRISGRLHGLKPGYHGFHIHRCGDLRNGCESACEHFNPDNTTHGGLVGGHAGDLGNIRANRAGIAVIYMYTDKFTIQSIVGRSLIIHADADDLGKGKNEDSLNTGNSGKRVACEVIGIANDSLINVEMFNDVYEEE
jgi:Cu-Zn family superoxide dismutase